MANGGGSEHKAIFDLAYPRFSKTKSSRLLNLAQRYYSRQNYTSCMQALAVFIGQLFASRVEPVGRLARQVLPAPECIQLIRTDLGIRVLLTQRELVEPDCATLFSYAHSLSKLIGGSPTRDCTTNGKRKKIHAHIPGRSLAESGALRIESRLTQWAAIGELLPGYRIKLTILVRLYFFLLRRIPLIREQMSLEMIKFGAIFHEPVDNIESLLEAHYLYTRLYFARHVKRMRKVTLPGIDGQFYWPEKSAYQRLVTLSNESRLLTTIHMGDVVGAFRSISAIACNGRRAISIMPKNDGPASREFSVSDNVEHTSTNANDMNPIAMIGELRGGNTTLAVLFDLTSEFGETVEVEFFGRKANFVKGPALMAVAAKIKILPFVTYEADGRDVLEMGSLIETDCLAGETLHNATIRITQMLATQAEKWIMRYPEQWRYTTSIFNFFNQNRETLSSA
jgi:hypothetical protein